jgi:cyanophycinase
MITTLAVMTSLVALAQNPAPADAVPTALSPTDVGPRQGALVIVGGGQLGPEIVRRFVTLAGGKDADVVVIPTAAENDPVDTKRVAEGFSRTFGFKNVTVIHTRDRTEADSEGFVAPLKKAKAVWFNGGRQWRIVDSFLGTRTQREIEAVLERGGVIGGSSAGATIQGSYLVRGARDGNDILMAKGYEQGFSYLRGVAIDQHILPRHRTDDLVQVIGAHPELLGLGIDESTAVVVEGDRFEVIGRGVVGVYDGKNHDGKRYYFLASGERYDLKQRRRVSSGANGFPQPGPGPRPTSPGRTTSPAVGPTAEQSPPR